MQARTLPPPPPENSGIDWQEAIADIVATLPNQQQADAVLGIIAEKLETGKGTIRKGFWKRGIISRTTYNKLMKVKVDGEGKKIAGIFEHDFPVVLGECERIVRMWVARENTVKIKMAMAIVNDSLPKAAEVMVAGLTAEKALSHKGVVTGDVVEALDIRLRSAEALPRMVESLARVEAGVVDQEVGNLEAVIGQQNITNILAMTYGAGAKPPDLDEPDGELVPVIVYLGELPPSRAMDMREAQRRYLPQLPLDVLRAMIESVGVYAAHNPDFGVQVTIKSAVVGTRLS